MTDAGVIVTAFLNAYYQGDAATARAILADDLSFEGPSVTFSGADKFLASSAHVAPSVQRIEIRKAVVDCDDVFVFYDVHLDYDVQKFAVAQWFVLRKGKIAEIRMIFDTGPFRDTQPPRKSEDTAVDPICKMSVEKSSAAATRVRDGKTYYFCADACATAFDEGAAVS